MALREPINTELHHLAPGYDPTKAHEYYIRNRHLKGRDHHAVPPPKAAKKIHLMQPSTPVRQKQKQALGQKIQELESKLHKIENLILEKTQAAAKANPKAAAKKERALKEKNKPLTAAEKAKAARDSKQYREQHKSELKAKAKRKSGSGGGSSQAKPDRKASMGYSVDELRALATKVRGQIAVAKQKLAAL